MPLLTEFLQLPYRYEFEEFEHVASMKTLELKSQETHSGYKTFLAVGTVYNFGEDLTSKGRVRSKLHFRVYLLYRE